MSAARSLKLADNSPPHVRAELFVAITAVREAEERLAENNARVEALWEKTFAALTSRQAKQKRVEAEESLEDIREARKFAEEAQRSLENELSWAKSRLKDRVADLVRADPSVRRLCEKFVETFRSFVDQRRAIEFLRLKGVLPDEFKFVHYEDPWPDLAGDKPWRAAFADLELDANAPLPEV